MVIKRNTWIVLGLFVVVLAFAFAFQRYKPASLAGTPTATSAEKKFLLNFDSATANSLKIEDTQGKSVVIGRDASGTWVISQPTGGETDPALVEQLISQIGSLQILSTPNQLDLSVFGLNKPSGSITITLNGGEKHVIMIGNVIPTGNGYYAQLDGSQPVILDKDSVDAILKTLTQPPFKPTATPTAPVVQGPAAPGVSTPTPAQP